MTDAALSKISPVDLPAVLDEVVAGGDVDAGDKIYKKLYKKLMETLVKDSGNIRGLMSQAIVPRLIRKMAKISPKEKRTDESLLKAELLKADEDVTPDYPYARTQIIEVWAKLQKGEGPSLYKIFKDPLLATAVVITNALMGENARNLNTQGKREKFSKGVNKIQDVILRNMIQNEEGVIPMIGDKTLPAEGVEKGWKKKKKERSAFGFGENPNPEVAAILNPGLVMNRVEQKQYHKELATLARLISPKESKNLLIRSVKDAFVKVGFEIDGNEVTKDVLESVSILTKTDGVEPELVESLIVDVTEIEEARGQTVIGGLKASLETAGKTIETLNRHIVTARNEYDENVKKIKELELENKDRGTEMKEFKDERKEAQQREIQYQKTIANLNEQLLLSGIEEDDEDEVKEEEEAKTDYDTEAMNFLIRYLGVKEDIFKFTRNWMELYALKPTHAFFDEYRKDFKKPPKSKIIQTLGLSKLIAGQEYVSVRKSPLFIQSTKKPVKFTHKDMITNWPKVEHQPTQDDLIVVNATLSKGAQGIVENIKVALEQHKKALLSSTEIVTQAFPVRHAGFDSIPSTTESRRRRRRNKKDERVLIW